MEFDSGSVPIRQFNWACSVSAGLAIGIIIYA